MRKRSRSSTGKTILIIDDNEDYLTASQRVIERDGHTVLTAPGGPEALELLRQQAVDLVLVDFLMPAMTGAEFVTELRKFNSLVQVILQTGYATEHPPRELMRRLDIQGYHDKSEGPDKLCLWVDVGLKAAFSVQLLENSRLGLRYVLNATPELHQIRPLEDLLQGILHQTAGLLGAVDSFLAITSPVDPGVSEGFVALVQEDDLELRAGTGRFAGPSALDTEFARERIAAVRAALASGETASNEHGVIVPLRIGERMLGAIYLDRYPLDVRDHELLDLFANQAAVAIQNVELYEMAALDSLTGCFARRFLEQALLRELHTAHRMSAPLALLMIDLDDMKGINDRGGHLAGDRALAEAGKLLRRAVRTNDVCGRYGGDEFAVLLPGADAAGAELVVQRIMRAFAQLSVDTGSGSLPVKASVGVAVLEPTDWPTATPCAREAFDETALRLVKAADEQLYRDKADRGRGESAKARTGTPLEPRHPWARPSLPLEERAEDGVSVDGLLHARSAGSRAQ